MMVYWELFVMNSLILEIVPIWYAANLVIQVHRGWQISWSLARVLVVCILYSIN